MKKPLTIKERLKAMYLILKHGRDTCAIEVCERCKGSYIDVGAQKTVKEANGTVTYYAKYFCKKCGSTCIATEIWEDNALLNFNKDE